ncbi:MAG: gamma-glutamylcyclotransferase [Nanoarchaeota archaeon]|nr:gamma-glutamylcyclotransferase [Nanoarchaeota archaeon]
MKNDKNLADKIKELGSQAWVNTANIILFGLIGPAMIAKHQTKMSLINSYYDKNGLFTFTDLDAHDKGDYLTTDTDDFGHPVTNLFMYGGLTDGRIKKFMLIFDKKEDVLEDYIKMDVRPLIKKHSIILPEQGSSVEGILVQIQPNELNFVDEFYGVAQNRIAVELESGEKAWTYSSFKGLY